MSLSHLRNIDVLFLSKHFESMFLKWPSFMWWYCLVLDTSWDYPGSNNKSLPILLYVLQPWLFHYERNAEIQIMKKSTWYQVGMERDIVQERLSLASYDLSTKLLCFNHNSSLRYVADSNVLSEHRQANYASIESSYRVIYQYIHY